MQDASIASGPLVDLAARVAELVARDHWSADRLAEHRQTRLRALLAHAARHSPYYREAFRGKDLATVPLGELPTLDKTTLIAELDRIVTVPGLGRREIEAHLVSPHASQRLLGQYRLFSSSGTSGQTAYIVQSAAEFGVWLAAVLRSFARIGVGRDARLVMIGAPFPLHLSQQLSGALQLGRRGVPALNVLTPMPEMTAALNAYQPEVLVSYSGMLGVLARAQLDGKLRIAPRLVGGSAEVLTDLTRQAILAAWGIEPAQLYASTEAPCMASSMPPERALVGYDDLCVLEVVDHQHQPVPPGVAGAKVLVTNLVSWTQPLIRYELGDSITLAAPASGSPFSRITSIGGRTDEILHLPARGGGEVSVHPYALHLPFAKRNDVAEYQIVRADGQLCLRLVLRPGAAADTPALLRAELAATLEAAGAIAPQIHAVAVTSLQREPGPGAKLKLVRDERVALAP